MPKLTRLALVSSAVLLPLLLDGSASFAQERQGCFMINAAGRLIDLSDICPAAVPFTPPVSATATTQVGTQTLGTGDIQVTLRWTSNDDLDLAVTDPAGDVVAFFNRSVPSQGQLDVDANAGCADQTNSPIENIFWPPGGAPQGQYNIEVNLFSRCNESRSPIRFNLTVLVQGTTRTYEGSVSDSEPVARFPFSLPPR